MKRSLILITATLLLAACTSELDQSLNGNRAVQLKQRTLFHATIEASSNPDTKVYADDQLQVLWNADDRISVFEKNTYNTQLKFLGEDGDNAGDFDYVGTPSSPYSSANDIPNTYAVYPYASGTKISNNCIISFTLPDEQAYKQNSFGIGANTMIAMTTDRFLSFKNVGGYLAIRLYGDNISVSKITLKGNNGEKIAGKASISVSQDGFPSVTMTEEATETISIVCDPPVQIGTSSANCTDFWFVIPPTHFTKGFSVTVTDAKGGTFEKSTSNPLDIKRNTLSRMEPIEVVPNYDHAFVPFEDDNFKAYCVENFDKDDDGEISIAEAKLVTTLTVNPEIVASLKGIEYFKNLQSLTCRLQYDSATLSSTENHFYRNGEEIFSLLMSLDVSNNLELNYLDCSTNQLASLDVSNNTALTSLQCYGNQLTSLGVSNNTALVEFDCGYNHLTSLEVSNNIALTMFDCSANSLSSLDVSNNTALAGLYCNSNQLTSLDVTKNTALQYLFCFNNQLSSLDVSQNTALQSFYCDNNQLTSLDVSKNSALSTLDCSYNASNFVISIRSGQIFRYFNYDKTASIVEIGDPVPQGNISFADPTFKSYCVEQFDIDIDGEISYAEALLITEVYCSNQGIISLAGIEYFANLRYLICYSNQLTSLDVSQNFALESLDCTNNPSLSEIWLKTGQTIDDFRYDTNVATIKYKDASGGEIIVFQDDNFKAYCVAEFDTNNDGEISRAEALEIKEVFCAMQHISSLSGIEYFSNLERLTCWSNQLTNIDVSQNTALTELDCKWNQLTSLDISKNASLTLLDCYSNQLSELDVSNNTALMTLICNSNLLSGLDLSKNTKLTELICDENHLTYLIVNNNVKLERLSCGYNKLTSLDVSNNTALTVLECRYNQLTSLDVSNNILLERLSCEVPTSAAGGNRLTSLDVSKNTFLKYLNCSCHPLDYLDVSYNTSLETFMCIETKLASLDVSNNTALESLCCENNPSLSEIWLKTGQIITNMSYDTNVATIKYKD